MRAVEEYLVYLEDPVLADKQWLGIQINEALARVDTYDEAVADAAGESRSACSRPGGWRC